MKIDKNLTPNKIARELWLETVSSGRKIDLPEMIDTIARKIGEIKESKLPIRWQIAWYRSNAETALRACKYEIIGTDNFDRYKHLFTKTEKWFHTQGLDKLFKLHLCKDESDQSLFKKWKIRLTRWLYGNSSVRTHAARWDEKVKKYSGKENFLITSHLAYLAAQKTSAVSQDVINAFKRVKPKFLESQSEWLDQLPLLKDGLKTALNHDINPNKLNYDAIAKNFATGILQERISQLPEESQKQSLEKAALTAINHETFKLKQLATRPGLTEIAKHFITSYLLAQIEDQKYDPTNYRALLKTIEETDFNQLNSVPDLLLFQANVAKNIATLKTEQTLKEYIGLDLVHFGEKASQLIDRVSNQSKKFIWDCVDVLKAFY